MKKRKKVVQGGTSGGKTHGIIPILIDTLARTKLKCTIVAETIPAVKDGAVAIFKQVMQETNRWRADGWIGSPMDYTFANGSVIQFRAYDTVGKAKLAGKRDILFINEANHVAYDIADALMIRSQEIWLDFNADVEFWAHTEVLTETTEEGEQVAELLILTYEDNEACPAATLEDLLIKKRKAYIDPNGDLESKANIKSEFWHNWWKVFGRGLIGNISELRIMPLLNRCKFPQIPEDAIEIPSYLDFGWFPDPIAFGRLFVRQGDETDDLYIVPLVYQTKLSINSKATDAVNLVDILPGKRVNPKQKIIAESADPRCVQEMRAAKPAYNIEAVNKQEVASSLRYFHDYNIWIVETEDNKREFQATWDEFDKYRYKKDKATGSILKVPEDSPKQADHSIDGVRYVLLSKGGRWSLPKRPKPDEKAAA